MEKKRFCGAAALLLVTAAVLACAGGDVEARKLAPAPDPEETMSSERAKQILRAYFADQYSEAGCSAVPYTPTALGAPAYAVGSSPLPSAVARTSRWQCLYPPAALPVLPIMPSAVPLVTFCPTLTSRLSQWQKYR